MKSFSGPAVNRILRPLAMLAALSCAPLVNAAEAARLTYANPIDIDYRYNFEQLISIFRIALAPTR